MTAILFGLAFVFAPASWAQLTSAQKEQIGFTALQQLLGPQMPAGANLSVTMVEAPDGSGNYRLNTANTQLQGKTFQFPSGGATGSSGHATTVARFFFGSSSLAPSIGRADQGQTIANYEVNNWLGSGYLKPANNQLPLVETRTLMNHSWVGTTGNTNTDTEYLRRMDYAINRDGFLATFGLNNGSATPIPNLMASTYNGIVVGLSNGAHSRGTTTIDGSGRTKPDIVVPTDATSWAAPTVGSAAALLVETARANPQLTGGDKSVVLKSLLLTGASREGDHVPFSWSNSTTQPLNSIYGAGQLNIFESYQILTGGKFNASPSSDAGIVGWGLGTASSVQEQFYFFDIHASGAFSASLSWNRNVTATLSGGGPNQTYSFTSSLANLDLRLYSATGYSLDNVVSASLSTVDNVELIYLSLLAPGRYALGVTSSTNSVEYGISWQAIPEPGTGLLLIMGFGLIMWMKKRRQEAAQSAIAGLSHGGR